MADYNSVLLGNIRGGRGYSNYGYPILGIEFESGKTVNLQMKLLSPKPEKFFENETVITSDGYFVFIAEDKIYDENGTVSASLIRDLNGKKGDTGATGPKGDKGDTGAQGVPGAKGTDGADGATIQSIASNTSSSTVSSGKTITPITVSMTDGTSRNFEIAAANGRGLCHVKAGAGSSLGVVVGSITGDKQVNTTYSGTYNFAAGDIICFIDQLSGKVIESNGHTNFSVTSTGNGYFTTDFAFDDKIVNATVVFGPCGPTSDSESSGGTTSLNEVAIAIQNTLTTTITIKYTQSDGELITKTLGTNNVEHIKVPFGTYFTVEGPGQMIELNPYASQGVNGILMAGANSDGTYSVFNNYPQIFCGSTYPLVCFVYNTLNRGLKFSTFTAN